ncbi:MAG: 50S ribosomal protein L31e [Candidatus Bathyarchaeia archaeon]
MVEAEKAENIEEGVEDAKEGVEDAREVEQAPSEAEDETIFEEIEERPSREEEERFVEERIYTIPLSRAWIKPPNKRAPGAIRILEAFIQRHMKVGEGPEIEEEEGGRIIISNEVNEKIWSRGIEKPPRKLRIRAAKDEAGNVTIFLA